ncbi:MAG: dienelactone hydrolase family protein [Alphaproteobacteria bacterium]|nr:dienelactone hydrolase family protein [Alphaproteobacteria bacterium]
MTRITRYVLVVLMISLSPLAAHAGEALKYHDGETELEGYWVPQTCKPGENAPLVLVIHQWKGLSENEKMRADMLAGQCYNAFAVDMYGTGIRPQTNEEAGKLAGLYKGDSELARRRIKAALDFALTLKGVDTTKVAAIGYCFGGTMALELARSGADINGVVSFHGGLGTKAPVTKPGIIKASVQVHHGAEDPFVPPEEFNAFINEMRAADADWAVTQYAHAVHAFTHKDAGSDPSKGMAYDEKADTRSWSATLNFLQEIFKS